MSWIFQFFFWKDSLKKEKAEGKETEISEKDREKSWEEAAHTPYGAYPETVYYTLGKISGRDNSNLPAGDTYEDNGYTRYLRKMLNIQNEDVLNWRKAASMRKLWKWQLRTKTCRIFWW